MYQELKQEGIFAPGQKHMLVKAKVEKVMDGKVVLDREFEGAKEVEYEVSSTFEDWMLSSMIVLMSCFCSAPVEPRLCNRCIATVPYATQARMVNLRSRIPTPSNAARYCRC